MYGITDTGFEPKRLQDLRADLLEGWKQEFGAEIRTDDESVFGQIAGVTAKPLAELWELAEKVYNSLSVYNSSGAMLDTRTVPVGVKRAKSTASSLMVSMWIENRAVTIPAGILLQAKSGVFFRTITGTTARNISQPQTGLKFRFRGGSPAGGAGASIQFNFPGHGAIDKTVANGTGPDQAKRWTLETFFMLDTKIHHYVDPDDSSIWCFTSKDPNFMFTVVISDDKGCIELIQIESLVPSCCETPGPIAVPAGDLRTIVSGVDGLKAVSNRSDTTRGRNEETDDELKIRYRKSLKNLGSTNTEAIKAHIENNVPGVSTVLVVENDRDTIYQGMPPHSIAVVAAGSYTPATMAQAVYDSKAGGIPTYSSDGTEATVVDSMGYSHIIRWSHPTPVPVFVNIRITKFREEAFPTDVTEQTVFDILSQFVSNNQTVGLDVIVQKLPTALYNTIPGIYSIAITGGRDNEYGNIQWYNDAIPIGPTELAQLSDAKTYIIIDPTPKP